MRHVARFCTSDWRSRVELVQPAARRGPDICIGTADCLARELPAACSITARRDMVRENGDLAPPRLCRPAGAIRVERCGPVRSPHSLSRGSAGPGALGAGAFLLVYAAVGAPERLSMAHHGRNRRAPFWELPRPPLPGRTGTRPRLSAAPELSQRPPPVSTDLHRAYLEGSGHLAHVPQEVWWRGPQCPSKTHQGIAKAAGLGGYRGILEKLKKEVPTDPADEPHPRSPTNRLWPPVHDRSIRPEVVRPYLSGASLTAQNTDHIETNNLTTRRYPQHQVCILMVPNSRVEAARLHDRVASKQDCAKLGIPNMKRIGSSGEWQAWPGPVCWPHVFSCQLH
jgi:hypothetical protein